MLAITYTTEDLRLLEAADIAERNADYDQRWFIQPCGTPGCLLGGYAAAHPERWEFLDGVIPVLKGGDSAEDYLDAVTSEFNLKSWEWTELFEREGCNNAGTDGKKAAAYVRKFVEERAKARLMG
jgi:hypothetical protein